MTKEEWCNWWKIPESERDEAWERKRKLDNKVSGHSALVVGDIEPFISSLDGSLISGRSSLREHNARNNVVCAVEVQGLPPRLAYEQLKPTEKERQEVKRTLWHAMNSNRR